MKTLGINLLGKKSFDQCRRITIKSLYKEIEDRLREELLKVRLDGIEIIHTKSNYGGYRKWFKCPNCSERVFILYDFNGKLKCRKCLKLHYKSQNLSGNLKKSVKTEKNLHNKTMSNILP